MYVCMYACMYVCLYVCMYAWMYVCMYVYTYLDCLIHFKRSAEISRIFCRMSLAVAHNTLINFDFPHETLKNSPHL